MAAGDMDRRASFTSSRYLAWKIYVQKYLDRYRAMGDRMTPQVLAKMVEMVEQDFPNDRVHPGDVIIALVELAASLARTSGRDAGVIARAYAAKIGGDRRPLTDRLTEKGILLPGRLKTH